MCTETSVEISTIKITSLSSSPLLPRPAVTQWNRIRCTICRPLRNCRMNGPTACTFDGKTKKWDLAALVVSNDRRYVIQQVSVFNDPLYFLIVPVNTYIVQWLNQFTIQNDE